MSKEYYKNGPQSSMYFEGGIKIAGNQVVCVEPNERLNRAVKQDRINKATKQEYEAFLEKNKPVSKEERKVSREIQTTEQKPKEADVSGITALVKQGLKKDVLKEVSGGWIKMGEETLGRSEKDAAKELASNGQLLNQLVEGLNKPSEDSSKKNPEDEKNK